MYSDYFSGHYAAYRRETLLAEAEHTRLCRIARLGRIAQEASAIAQEASATARIASVAAIVTASSAAVSINPWRRLALRLGVALVRWGAALQGRALPHEPAPEPSMLW
jgi:hypothetical protein